MDTAAPSVPKQNVKNHYRYFPANCWSGLKWQSQKRTGREDRAEKPAENYANGILISTTSPPSGAFIARIIPP